MTLAVLAGIFPDLHTPPIAPEKDFQLGPLVITNSKLASVIALALVILVAWLAGRRMEERPRGFQNAMEALVEALYNFARSTGGRYGVQVFPVFASLFVYLLVANELALLPGFAQIRVSHGDESWPLLRAVNADFNSPLAMALMVFCLAHYYGVKSHGIGYFNEFLNVRALRDIFLKGRLGGIMDILVGFFETIGNLARIVSLSVRLFANVYAGEILIAVLLALFPLAAIPFAILEIAVVAIIQALIFGLLMLVYISLVGGEHSDHEQDVASHHSAGDRAADPAA